MTEILATGSIKFIVRSGSTPVEGARVYTSVNQITWYFRGITNSIGVLMALGIPAGLNYYMVSMPGYNTARGSTNVPANGGVQIDIYLTKSLSTVSTDMVGSLTVSSTPEGAQVYINESIQELPTPVTIQGLPEGDYVLRLSKNGYEDLITSVTIMRRQTAIMSANVIPVANR